MFQQLFEKIHSKLSGTEIKIIEWYLDQDKQPGGIINIPATFIRFYPAKIKALNKYYEEVRIEFDVIIFTGNLKSNNKVSSDTNNHFFIEGQIDNTLKDFEKTGWESVTRHSSGLLRSTMVYTYYFNQLTSYSKNFELNNTPVQPNIDTNLDLSP